jgi:Flp pilus assembly protein TadD/4-amino-4-deoxy-L-arabinose transferase-like glycosyltransferase
MPPGSHHEPEQRSGPCASGGRRGADFLLPGLLLLAFCVRVIYVLQSRSNPFFADPDMDALYHTDWARAIAAGRSFIEGPYFRAPLYPWFLGLCFRLFGEDFLVPRLIQAGFGAATVGLTWLIGREVGGRPVAALAALGMAGYRIAIYFDGELLIETLYVPLCLLALWLTLRLWRRRGLAATFLAGVAWGVAALARPNHLALMPLLAVWVFTLARPSLRGGLAAAGALALGTIIPILPVTVRNLVVGHDLVLVSSQGGVNFWIGNNPKADGTLAVVPGTRSDWWGGYHDSIALAEAEAGRQLKPSEVSRHYSRKAWAFIAGEPRRAARLFLWKLRLFWTAFELSNNQAEEFLALRYGPVLRWLPLGFGFVAPLGLLGLVLALRGGLRLAPLPAYLVVSTAVVVFFFVNARYRLPAVPVLMVLGAMALRDLFRAAKERRWRRLAAAACFLVPAFAAVNAIPSSVDTTEASGLNDLAILYARRGEPDRALALLREAVALQPARPDIRRNLGKALVASGRTEEGLAELAAALRRKPDDVEAMDTLGEQYLRLGRFAEAEAVARQSVARAPAAALGHYHLGQALVQTGRLAAAEAPLRRAVELAPGGFNGVYSLASLLERLGRPAEAAAFYRRALEIHGGDRAGTWYVIARQGLIRSLRAAGFAEEAAEEARPTRARGGQGGEAARPAPAGGAHP